MTGGLSQEQVLVGEIMFVVIDLKEVARHDSLGVGILGHDHRDVSMGATCATVAGQNRFHRICTASCSTGKTSF